MYDLNIIIIKHKRKQNSKYFSSAGLVLIYVFRICLKCVWEGGSKPGSISTDFVLVKIFLPPQCSVYKCLLSPQAVFSAAAQLTASVLTSEETKRLSPDEDEFHSCQSGSNSTSNSHSGSSESVNVDDTKNHAPFGITPTNAETGSTKTTLTSVTDSGLVPVIDHNHPLSEVVVSSTTTDHVTSTGEDNLSFLSRQPQQTAS